MKIPESYVGREQTFIKHHLLRAYLERLFMIIGQHQSVIRYVDCFSGPWNEKDEKLQDTSIGISLGIMSKCLDGLTQMRRDVCFHALFIEKNKRAFKKLEAFTNSHNEQNVTVSAYNGDFFANRDKILDWCGHDDFTFFFVDPKGWKKVVEVSTLEPFLKRPNSEFLINFMYDFLLRTHTQHSFAEDMREIFGEVPDTSEMTPHEKETKLINLYRARLKQIAPVRGGKPRTAHVRILYPLKDRALYHLFYVTRHSKGIQVFMGESEKLEFVQKQVRAKTKQENRIKKSRQLELFDSCNDIRHEIEVDLDEVKAFWLRLLSIHPIRFGIEQLADMIEQTGWFESNFQAAFKELTDQGLVANLDDSTGRRRTRFVRFDANYNQGEQLIKLKL